MKKKQIKNKIQEDLNKYRTKSCIYLLPTYTKYNCFLGGKCGVYSECVIKYKCKNYIHITNIKERFQNIIDIPQLLLLNIIHDSVVNFNCLTCHNLSELLQIYFDQISIEAIYKGEAFRKTENIKQEISSGKFFNFSKLCGGYSGSIFSGNGQPPTAKNYKCDIIGVDINSFFNKYITNKNKTPIIQKIQKILESESIVIGKALNIQKKT